MAVPADTTNVMIDAAAPVSPVVLRLGDGTTRTLGGVRRVYSATAVTDGAGNAVFTHNAPAFAVAPVCAIGVQTANTNATEARITANSTTSTTVNVRQSPGIVLLGISVLQVPQPLAGATVHLIAFEPGLE